MALAHSRTGKCPVDGTDTRLMFPKGKGTKARTQHSRWHVCEKGHKLYIKRGNQ